MIVRSVRGALVVVLCAVLLACTPGGGGASDAPPSPSVADPAGGDGY